MPSPFLLALHGDLNDRVSFGADLLDLLFVEG